MKTYLFIAFIIPALASCTLQRHTVKNKSTLDWKNNIDSTFERMALDHSRSILHEVITMSADTGTLIPGTTRSGRVKEGIIYLPDGESITFSGIHSDSFKIITPPRTISFHYNKRTERNSTLSSDETSSMHARVNTTSELKQTAKNISRTSNTFFGIPWWIWLVGLAVLTGSGYYFYRRISKTF